MMEEDALDKLDLNQAQFNRLKALCANMSILADVCRADLLLYAKCPDGRALTVAQAMPHSVSPLYKTSRVGVYVGTRGHQDILDALDGHGKEGVVYTITVRGATVAREVFRVRDSNGQIIAVLASDSYWLAYERHRRRSLAFQQGLTEFVRMVLRGELYPRASFTPFGEHDGLLLVGANRRIQYMSGIAQSMYRRLGFRDNLVGVSIDQLATVDSEMVEHTLGQTVGYERQDEQYGLTWMRKSLPINAPVLSLRNRLRRGLKLPIRGRIVPYGVFILLHDATEALEAQREIESKTAMLREVHHRVKNNLQVIASLLQMQARRVQSEEAKSVLEESVNRIQSVAVVHEFLSQGATGTIDLKEIATRIVFQIRQGLLAPSSNIRLSVQGESIWLPAEQATRCSLVVNELVQNAIEHGTDIEKGGLVEVSLVDHGDSVSIVVQDDGQGLPEGFDLDSDAHLGLRIVKSMVERDLRGTLQLLSIEGTRVVVSFDKALWGGE